MSLSTSSLPNNDLSLNKKTNVFSNRVLSEIQLAKNQGTNYQVNIPGIQTIQPSKLGSKYISDLIKVDSNTPELYHDLNNNLDSYNFDYSNGLGDFSRFEKVDQINLPDKILEEYNTTECLTKMGLFPDIDRAWIAVDNKLIFWNYKSSSKQFLTIDEIRHTILAVKLVKPKPNVFVDEINYLLVLSTPMDIHILIIKYDNFLNNLEIFNPDLSVPTQGLIVNNFITYNETNEIFFCGEGDETNVWKLDYSNKSTFRKNRCDKICLTKNGMTSFLPSKFPGLDMIQSGGTNVIEPESIQQLEIDQSRGILYTLSNRSNIRAYKIKPNQNTLGPAVNISPSTIFKGLSTTNVDISVESLNPKKFKIVSIEAVTSKESSTIYLIAITNYGCRIFINGSSNLNYLALGSFKIKFAPSKEMTEKDLNLDAFSRERKYESTLIKNQQQSVLLKNTKYGKIISPGIFISVKRTKKSDKLFIVTANYGFLKKNGILIEDAEFVADFNNTDENCYIQEVIQLTPSMNATDKPNGFANVNATQYTKETLKFAVLTNMGISIYKYRTPDNILASLKEETLDSFITVNGFEETCSTLLYLSCQYGRSDILKNKAQVLFSTCGNNARLSPHSITSSAATPKKPGEVSHASMDDVLLSDRFYGTCLLISRLFRNYWNENIFIKLPYIKTTLQGEVQVDSIKEDNLLIKGINIDKQQIEYFIGSVIILLEFFNTYGNNVPGLNAPNYSSDPSRYELELCLRAEHISFTSIIKVLDSMKEALSFLMVLIEESQLNKSNLAEILKYLSMSNQLNLLRLSFKDLLVPNNEVKNLIKDLLSSIINKNILKGGSIDLIATSLQSRCGSFCSPNDVLIFKAIENLQKAKIIGNKDNDLKLKCLNNSVKLFEKACDSLTLENIENSINIMIELNFFTGAIEFLLNIANRVEKSVTSTTVAHQQSTALVEVNKTGNPNVEGNQKFRLDLYKIIFRILETIDLKAIKTTDSNNQMLLNEIVEIRDLSYETAFNYPDKIFHYQFYQWFIDQGISERLLEINTPYILSFLEEKSENDLNLSNLLWLYHAKREHYFAAAQILYSLSISEFKLMLNQRIEYLSRANGFCNCVCPPNLRQKMISLSSVIQELFDVATVQLDVLTTIDNDKRISKEHKEVALSALNYKVLTISDLFNNYTDPLGYYDLCLLIFKVSDHRNTDDILKRWELFFEKIYVDYTRSKIPEPIHIIISNEFTRIGKKLSSNDLVFPIDELIKLIAKYINLSMETDSTQQLPVGSIVDMFINSHVSYDKLYYVLQNVIENNSFEIYDGFITDVKNEMLYLIKNWYNVDRKLRDIISSDKINNLSEYSVSSDPINNYIKVTGMPI